MFQKKLSPSEIKAYSAIPELNARRDQIQHDAVTIFSDQKKLVLEWCTAAGKTYFGVKAIKRCQAKVGGNYIVVVPEERLVTSWKEKLVGVDNVFIYVVNSFTMSTKIQFPDNVKMVLYDEAHHYLNENSVYFSRAVAMFPDVKLKVLLSATFSKEQLQYAEALGFNYRYTLSLLDAFKMELVASYVFYNIGVDFTEEEKKKYIKIQDSYKNYLNYFETYLFETQGEDHMYKAAFLAGCVLPDKKSTTVKWEGQIMEKEDLINSIAVTLDVKPWQVLRNASGWRRSTGERARLFYNAENKAILLDRLLNLLPDEKVIAFVYSKEATEKLVKKNPSKRQSYHSGKSNKNVLTYFRNKTLPHLCVIRKADEGDIDDEVSWGVQTFYTSKTKENVQRIGRFVRKDIKNLSKTGVLVSAYVKDFEVKQGEFSKTYPSMDIKWLTSSQKGQRFINWIDDISQIQELNE